MNARKKRILLAVLLMLSIGNFSRISGTETIRTVAFLSVFVIGALSALLLREVISMIKNR